MVAGLMGLVVASCGSSPSTHYFTLDPVGGAQTGSGLPSGALVKLDTVTIPPQLDRLQIVRRIGANQVDVAGSDRWAGPLDEQIRAVLSQDLSARLPAGTVVAPAATVPAPEVRLVSVDVLRFEADVTGRVSLSVDWAVVSGGKAVFRRTEQIEQPTAGAAMDLTAATMSAALGVLADHIAASLNR